MMDQKLLNQAIEGDEVEQTLRPKWLSDMWTDGLERNVNHLHLHRKTTQRKS